MKTRDIKALHTKDLSELRTMLTENQMALRDARLELGQQKLSSTSSLTNFRRDIARIQTVMRMKVTDMTVPTDEAVKEDKNDKVEAKKSTKEKEGNK